MFAFDRIIWTQHILSGSEVKLVEQKSVKCKVEELLTNLKKNKIIITS